MDFVELEAIEGLRWSWNSWPASKSEALSLVIPLSIMCTPLMESSELPILPYEPLICVRCGAALNPYARVDYQSKIWLCPFCYHKNLFPKSYAGIGENNLPAELFPTYGTVEYHPRKSTLPVSNSGSNLSLRPNWGSGLSSSSLSSLVSSANSSNASLSVADLRVNMGPAFVFVVDLCMAEDELGALKNELLLVVSQLPENALVGLVTFDSMVKVYDLGFADCTKVVLFHGDRELSSTQIQKFLQLRSMKQPHLGKGVAVQKQGFLLAVSECEFSITAAIEEIHSSGTAVSGHRPLRATGTAISVAVGLLEGCMVKTGSRVMVFTCGPATIGPGIVVQSDLGYSLRNQRDLVNGLHPFLTSLAAFIREYPSVYVTHP